MKWPEKQKLAERLGSGRDDTGGSDVLPLAGCTDRKQRLRGVLSMAAGATSHGMPPILSTQQAPWGDSSHCSPRV